MCSAKISVPLLWDLQEISDKTPVHSAYAHTSDRLRYSHSPKRRSKWGAPEVWGGVKTSSTHFSTGVSPCPSSICVLVSTNCPWPRDTAPPFLVYHLEAKIQLKKTSAQHLRYPPAYSLIRYTNSAVWSLEGSTAETQNTSGYLVSVTNENPRMLTYIQVHYCIFRWIQSSRISSSTTYTS